MTPRQTDVGGEGNVPSVPGQSVSPVPPDGENPIRDMNPYRYEGANLMSRAAWDSGYSVGFAAGRAAATPDPPEDVRRWEVEVCDECGRQVSDSTHATSVHQNGPTHFEPVVAAADYDRLAAASPDERLREAAAWLVELAAAAVCEPRRFAENETELQWKAADAITATRAALAAADREKPPAGSDGEDR